MKPCEVCGYAFGSAWLFEPLPDEVRATLAALPDPSTVDPSDAEAAAFLERFHLTFAAEHAQAKAKAGLGSAAQHWRVTLSNGRARRLSFDFWNSQHDTAKGLPLRAYSVLACLSSDSSYTDPDEIARELELSPSKARAVATFARRIQRFFTAAELAALQEIR